MLFATFCNCIRARQFSKWQKNLLDQTYFVEDKFFRLVRFKMATGVQDGCLTYLRSVFRMRTYSVMYQLKMVN
jgi:hypothetical protein